MQLIPSSFHDVSHWSTVFTLISIGLFVVTVLTKRTRGGLRKRHSIRLGVFLAVGTFLSAQGFLGMVGQCPIPAPVLFLGQGFTYFYMYAFVQGRMGSSLYQWAVRIGCFHAATALTSGVFRLTLGWFVPVYAANCAAFVATACGVYQSSAGTRRTVSVVHDGSDVDAPRAPVRLPDPVVDAHPPGARRSPMLPTRGEPLRVFQITDPHIGPWMSVRRLAKICEWAVQQNPDLIFLTGDFYTMQAHNEPEALARALAPLKAVADRTFACLGNHDYECLTATRTDLAAIGVTLLEDESVIVDTRLGCMQVVGTTFRYKGRKEHMEEVARDVGREPGCRASLWLVHNPSDFQYIPNGLADVTFSGHLHGGHIGLRTLGLGFTLVRLFKLFGVTMCDHGTWAKGRNRLYSHSGTGHYGFPLRLGTVNEWGMLHVYLPPATQ